MKQIVVAFVMILLAASFASDTYGQDLVFNNLNIGGAENVDQSSLADLDSVAVATATADGVVSFASDTIVSRIDFTGIYSGSASVPDTDNFTIRILEGGSGAPGAIVPGGAFLIGNNLTRIDSGFDLGTEDIFSFSAEIDFTFTADDDFFISFFNDTAGFTGTFEIASASSEGDGFFGSFDGGSSFPSSAPGAVDFQLFGVAAVPEPSTATLVCFAALSGLVRRRR